MQSTPRLGNDLPLPYPVRVERGLLRKVGELTQTIAPAHRYALIVDQTVEQLHRDALRTGFPVEHSRVFIMPPGEHEKTREQWMSLSDQLMQWGAGRDTTIVAIGGGVVGDVAGFVAATYMRGVPVIQVPTTLLAMVDASVGGKTGVDTSFGKNLIGAFHNPSAVFVDPDVLQTLPQPVFRSGLAEMIKHGVLASEEYFASLVQALHEIHDVHASAHALPELIAGSIAIKANVVADDARESGKRQVLNLGHTIAHALEQNFHYHMLHGDAVAIGLIVECEISERLGIAPKGLMNTVRDAVRAAGLPAHVPLRAVLTEVVASTHGDKKSRGGQARYALPTRIGEMSPGDGNWSIAVSDAVAMSALEAHVG